MFSVLVDPWSTGAPETAVPALTCLEGLEVVCKEAVSEVVCKEAVSPPQAGVESLCQPPAAAAFSLVTGFFSSGLTLACFLLLMQRDTRAEVGD